MYPSYPHNGFYYVQPSQRIPRTLIHNVDLDDYLQVQLLLQREQDRRRHLIEEEYERRRLEEEYRARLEEQRRLELALRRLQYCHQESQRQRDLTARETREKQRERRRLLAQAIAEDEYRRRVAAAIEQRRQAEATKRYREELLRVQHEQEEAAKYEEQRRRQLAKLLRHVFGHQVESDEEEEGEGSSKGLSKTEERASWEDYLDADEPLEEQMKEEQKKPQPITSKQGIPIKISVHDATTSKPVHDATTSKPVHDATTSKPVHDATTSKQLPIRQPSEIKNHVVTLQDLLQELLTTVPTPSTFDTQPDSDNIPAAPTLSESAAPALSKSATLASALPESAAPALSESTTPALSESAVRAKQVLGSLRNLSSLEARLSTIQSQHESRILSRPLSFHSDGRLSPVSDNRGFMEYEHELMQIILALDRVESFDEDAVREKRKGLVKRAEGLLSEIDDYKKKEWEKASSVDGEEARSEVAEVAEEVKNEEEKIEPYVIEDEAAAAAIATPVAAEVAESETPKVTEAELTQGQQEPIAETDQPTTATKEMAVDEQDVTESVEPTSTTEETTTTELDDERNVAEEVEPVTATEEAEEALVIEPQVAVEPSSEATEVSTAEAAKVESALGEGLADGPHQPAKHHVTVVEVPDGPEEEFVVV
ncbi:hypothetical protein BC937DRAFT_90657 [Endogone sp. FLAS-F59071]|nr:hypothetical protein BC937DRAFT_90657 [Endogone sp. FLAS-F59071]|eukprot:RUS16914.1 hypothetical protein BC937DRAFT_90657 [Endogone sp. FLAS-F59071]